MASDDAPRGTTASDAALNTASDAVRPDAAVESEAVELTAALVAIDSVNPGLVPGAAGEASVVAHLRDRLSHRGFATHVVEEPGLVGRPSLVAISPTSAPGPTAPRRRCTPRRTATRSPSPRDGC